MQNNAVCVQGRETVTEVAYCNRDPCAPVSQICTFLTEFPPYLYQLLFCICCEIRPEVEHRYGNIEICRHISSAVEHNIAQNAPAMRYIQCCNCDIRTTVTGYAFMKFCYIFTSLAAMETAQCDTGKTISFSHAD